MYSNVRLTLLLCIFFVISHGLPVPLGHVQGNLEVQLNAYKNGLLFHKNVQAPTSTESYKYDKFKVKTYGREEAVKEVEGVLSKLDTKYSKVQSVFQKEPIIDNIPEHVKYLNDGEKSRKIGHTIYGGFEIFSNVVNKAIETPKQASAVFLKNVNNVLGNIGAKLIG